MKRLELAAFVLGAALITGGTAAIYWPVALITVGLLLVVLVVVDGGVR